ncbi:MAG: hypothetical protein HOP96_06895 [Sphingomonas sp.]|nr:hypothetical protein [Sphingomonas sp.]
MFKILLGLVLAIFCALIAAVAAGFIVGMVVLGFGWTDPGNSLFYGAAFAWTASYVVVPAILVFTLPLHWLAIRLGRVRRGDYAAGGALFAISMLLIVLLTSGRLFTIPEQLVKPSLVIAPMLGAVAALAFWAVTRPDRAARPA